MHGTAMRLLPCCHIHRARSYPRLHSTLTWTTSSERDTTSPSDDENLTINGREASADLKLTNKRALILAMLPSAVLPAVSPAVLPARVG